MKLTSKFWIVLAIVFILLISNKIVSKNLPSNNKIISQLQTHRQLWHSQKIANYQYSYKQVCFCPLPSNIPVRVLVKNNKVIGVTPLETGQTLEEVNLDSYKTINQLFEIIENAVTKNADKITVTYNSKLGYPTEIFIDYIVLAADDEITYSATDLIKFDP